MFKVAAIGILLASLSVAAIDKPTEVETRYTPLATNKPAIPPENIVLAEKPASTNITPPQPEVRYSPFDAVSLATNDILAITALQDPSIDPRYCRYLSLHNQTKENRIKLKQVLDFAINSLNARYRKIVRTAVVPAGDDPVVIRLYLPDYNIDTQAWDNLAEKGSGTVPQADPYFHQTIEKLVEEFKEETYEVKEYWEGGVVKGKTYPPGEYLRTKTRKIKTGEKKDKVYASAPWLALETSEEDRGKTITSLIEATQCSNPILLGQWFLVYATWTPIYYEMIGLKRKDKDGKKVFLEKDFEDLVKFDSKLSSEEIVAAIADTKIVTLHNRILQRYPTVSGTYGGYYWRSKDTNKGINEFDYLNTLTDFENPKIQAQEIITSGRNGLHIYALTDDKGVLLEVADTKIAVHGDVMPTKFQDKQVYPFRNCALCHSEGQIVIQDKVRALARDKISLFISTKTKDKDISRKLEEAFQPDIRPIILTDNARYSVAVKGASTLDGKTVSSLYEEFVWDYYDQSVSLDKAALECGMRSDKLREALERGIGMDYSLTGFLQKPEIQTSRLPWENHGFGSMMNYVISWNVQNKK